MLDPRPLGYVVGLLLTQFGAVMAIPALLDILDGSENWQAFAISGAMTPFVGVALALACAAGKRQGLSIPQTFLLTSGVWVVFPAAGALPFMIGVPHVSFTDAFFEAMSGLTTTGATVFTGLELMPRSTLLWRGMMQWFGGVGIIVVALAFLPSLRVGGMQLFKSEGFDTFGKILPRAAEIAKAVSWVYVGLSVLCTIAYSASGMKLFDAVVNTMTTMATGGFTNYDSSFASFSVSAEYVAVFFMICASLPFARYVQLVAGSPGPLYNDAQVRGYLFVIATSVAAITLWRLFDDGGEVEPVFRRTLFNFVSVISGTGYASEDYGLWGEFPVALIFFAIILGGCSGSAAGGVKVFRAQVLISALTAQTRTIHSPSGVFTPRYEGRPIGNDVISSVMTFLFMFALTFGVGVVALAMMGVSPITAISGVATTLGNVGPGLGPEIGPSGNYAGMPDGAVWIFSILMALGRLELLSVYVLFTATFWRA